MLEARGLSKSYPAAQTIHAVRELDLRVEAGEFLAIHGPSGSGKSTLLAMLGGLCRPSQGQVLLDGQDLWAETGDTRAELRRQRIGFVFQFPSLLPTLRAIDNVALPVMIARSTSLQAAYQRAARLLYQVGLADRAEAYPGELSGGQQRRVALARALIHEPTIILADEPTGDLDEASESAVFQLLLDLHRIHHITLLVVTHNPTLAGRADRVILLRQGQIASTEVPKPTPDNRPLPLADTNVSAFSEPAPPIRLGADLLPRLASFAGWTALVVGLLFLLNQGVAFYQRARMQEKQVGRQALESTALHLLRADVENLAHGPDQTYLLTTYAQNLDPDQDLYIMAPSLRAFVQVGLQWQEVPLRPGPGQEGRVVKIEGKQLFEYVFQAEVPRFEELLPGYMHLRLSAATLVGKSSNPSEGLYERRDDYYLYLKPHGADDAAILRKTKYPGKPPVWIPMPPH